VQLTKMTLELPTADGSSPLSDIYRLIKADWVVVHAAARDDAWIRRCLEFCPQATYAVFPHDAAAHAVLERSLAPTGDRVHLGAVPLGRPSDGDAAGSVRALDDLRAERGLRHIHFLRIDTPEAAMAIVLGAQTALRHSRIDVIEIAGVPGGAEGLAPAAFILLHHNYVVLRVDGDEFKRLSQIDLASSRWTGNTLAIHTRLLANFTNADQDILDLPTLFGQHGVTTRGIIHVGAHECEELPTYLKLGAKHVLLVEANPILAERLRGRAKMVPEVTVAHCAVNDVDGPVDLHVLSKDESSSILPLKLHQKFYPSVVENEVIQVPGLRLDRLMESLALDAGDFNVMCVDVQGAELRALRGADKTLEAIDAISVEINFAELFTDCAQVEDIDNYLGDRGFDRVATLTPYHPAWGDALYVRRQRATPTNRSL
jgi:FkbM family methyltransferase